MSAADFMAWIETNKDNTNKPVIGILSQTLEDSMAADPRYEGYTSYISSTYVRWIESAGARVVPITSEESLESVADKLSKLNGVVLPGGGGDYNTTAEFIFNKVKEYNDNGMFYPLWGTCYGYEHIVGFTASIGFNALTRIEVHG